MIKKHFVKVENCCSIRITVAFRSQLHRSTRS